MCCPSTPRTERRYQPFALIRAMRSRLFSEEDANAALRAIQIEQPNSKCSPDVVFYGSLADGVSQTLRRARITHGRILVCTGESSAQRLGFSETLVSEAGIECVFESGITQDPQISSAVKLAERLGSGNFQAVVALGGGSVIDFAKIATAFVDYRDDVEAAMLAGEGSIPSRSIPLVAIPTTAGTGSEGSPFAVLVNASNKRVFARARTLVPDFGVVSTDVLDSLPQNVVKEVGFDAFAHALEALWSRSASRASDEFAVLALGLFGNYLPAFWRDPSDRASASQIAIASSFAGLAFGQAYTTLCHALSFPISEKIGVSHGKACALTIAQVAELYGSYHTQAITRVAEEWGLNCEREIPAFINELKSAMDETERLSNYGITLSEVPVIAQGANLSMIGNSAVAITREDTLHVLQAAV